MSLLKPVPKAQYFTPFRGPKLSQDQTAFLGALPTDLVKIYQFEQNIYAGESVFGFHELLRALLLRTEADLEALAIAKQDSDDQCTSSRSKLLPLVQKAAATYQLLCTFLRLFDTLLAYHVGCIERAIGLKSYQKLAKPRYNRQDACLDFTKSRMRSRRARPCTPERCRVVPGLLPQHFDIIAIENGWEIHGWQRGAMLFLCGIRRHADAIIQLEEVAGRTTKDFNLAHSQVSMIHTTAQTFSSATASLDQVFIKYSGMYDQSKWIARALRKSHPDLFPEAFPEADYEAWFAGRPGDFTSTATAAAAYPMRTWSTPGDVTLQTLRQLAYERHCINPDQRQTDFVAADPTPFRLDAEVLQACLAMQHGWVSSTAAGPVSRILRDHKTPLNDHNPDIHPIEHVVHTQIALPPFTLSTNACALIQYADLELKKLIIEIFRRVPAIPWTGRAWI